MRRKSARLHRHGGNGAPRRRWLPSAVHPAPLQTVQQPRGHRQHHPSATPSVLQVTRLQHHAGAGMVRRCGERGGGRRLHSPRTRVQPHVALCRGRLQRAPTVNSNAALFPGSRCCMLQATCVPAAGTAAARRGAVRLPACVCGYMRSEQAAARRGARRGWAAGVRCPLGPAAQRVAGAGLGQAGGAGRREAAGGVARQ